MTISKLSSCVAIAAVAASGSSFQSRAYADSPFRFYPFSSSSTSSSPSEEDELSNANSEHEEPRKLVGLDPEALERGAKALRYINKSPLAKQVFDLMRKQEKTRLEELDVEKAHYEAIQSQLDSDRQQKLAEERRNLVQQQAQAKAQMLRYEDELARKRMQEDHEAQRRHNTELVKMQEGSSKLSIGRQRKKEQK
ncbi:ATPase family AAA domain-containing protein 3-like [Tripterygium wilfordii]|uniref:ATPase family AAA domain-containing protein 3-like n=1 Tax=Tripterygium wilfordii TaxID=458696 RepID=A0A7J7CVU0_TRIWF|nr:ATPase family AAA domain-containing protein 3-like [Tripterygium wilfordii]